MYAYKSKEYGYTQVILVPGPPTPSFLIRQICAGIIPSFALFTVLWLHLLQFLTLSTDAIRQTDAFGPQKEPGTLIAGCKIYAQVSRLYAITEGAGAQKPLSR